MAYQLIRPGHSQGFPAASVVLPFTPVKAVGTSVPFILPCATSADKPRGMVTSTYGASGLAQAEVALVYEELNIIPAIAGASVGVFTEMVVGSSNGALVPVSAASPLIAASGHWVVGESQTAAGAGEFFSLYVKPRKA